MSRIREIETINNGFVSIENSTDTPLIGSGVFDGDWEDTLNYNVIIIGVKADQDSAADGMVIQWSADGVSVIQTDVFSIFADLGKVFTFSPANRYFKIVYTNGITLQTEFSIQSIFKKAGFKPSSHRVDDIISAEDDATLTTAVLKVITHNPDQYVNVDVQHPMPSDGDSIYAKDIDNNNSITTDWIDLDSTGEEIATIPFTGLFTRIQNTTTDNPKSLTIYFNRTILASGVGLGANVAGSFSNVKIVLLGSGGTERSAIDESADSTAYTSRIYTFKEDIYFNAIRFEFYTANTITLSNITAQKTTNVNVGQVEPTTNSLKVIDYSHAELHAGEHYLYKGYHNILKNTAHDHLIITPDTTRWAHFTTAVEALTSEVLVEMFEDTVTSADGSLAAIINRNRNMADDNTTEIYESPTVTAVGTKLLEFKLGAGKRSEGGSNRDSEEILLKQNTKYLFRVTEQNVATTDVNFNFDWYEHTNLVG